MPLDSLPANVFPLLWPPERVVCVHLTSKKLRDLVMAGGGIVQLKAIKARIPDTKDATMRRSTKLDNWRDAVANSLTKFTLHGFQIDLWMQQTTFPVVIPLQRAMSTILADVFLMAEARIGEQPLNIRRLAIGEQSGCRNSMQLSRLLGDASRSKKLESLELTGLAALLDVGRRPKEAEFFFEKLRAASIRSLSLLDISEPDEINAFLSEFPKLEKLERLEVGIDVDEPSAGLCQALEVTFLAALPPTVHTLILRKGPLRSLKDAVEGSFAKPKEPHVRVLELDTVFTPGEGLGEVLEALERNTALEVVRIRDCRFSVEAVKALAATLSKLPNLVEVDLTGARLVSPMCSRNLVRGLAFSDSLRVLRLHDVHFTHLQHIDRLQPKVDGVSEPFRVLPDYVLVPHDLGSQPQPIGPDRTVAGEKLTRAYFERVPGKYDRYIFGRGGDTVWRGANWSVLPLFPRARFADIVMDGEDLPLDFSSSDSEAEAEVVILSDDEDGEDSEMDSEWMPEEDEDSD